MNKKHDKISCKIKSVLNHNLTRIFHPRRLTKRAESPFFVTFLCPYTHFMFKTPPVDNFMLFW